MQMYVVVMIALSSAVNFLFLLGTNRLCGCRGSMVRYLLGAAVSGMHTGLCMLGPLRFLAGPLWRAVALAGVALIGFGMHRSTWRAGAVFAILSLAFNGIIQGANGKPGVTAVSALCLILLCVLAFWGRRPGQVYVPVEISQGDTCVQLTALRDTGNTLCDPITGQSMLVIDAATASRLTGLTREQLQRPVETMGKLPGLRLISYQTVDRTGGLMLAMKFQNVKIGKWKGSRLVAFAPEGLGRTYEALTGGVV